MFRFLVRILLPLFAASVWLSALAPRGDAAGGDLDTTFGGDGIVTTPIGSSHDFAEAVAIQADGKIVAAGYGLVGSNRDFAVVRYTTAGGLDTTFGGDGIVTTPIGSRDDYAQAVAIQADGKIVAAGYGFIASLRSDYDFALVRYTTAGGLDTTFGGDGVVTTPIGSRADYAKAVAIQADGKIVAAGYGFIASVTAGNDFALARYTSGGALDTTLGGDGIVTTRIGSSHDVAESVAIQPGGKIVLAGHSIIGSSRDFALARYTSGGALDSTFGGDGIVITRIGSSHDAAEAVAIQPDGKIVVAGLSTIGSSRDFALARYTTAGALDTAFGGGDGIVTTAIGSGGDLGRAVALQPDGNIVVAGFGFTTSSDDFVLVRFIGMDPIV
jgi:uncharacterized delta-60 repeat protein